MQFVENTQYSATIFCVSFLFHKEITNEILTPSYNQIDITLHLKLEANNQQLDIPLLKFIFLKFIAYLWTNLFKMPFLYIKALHIIFIVTWFAGLFYIVRLFIYQVEAHEKPEPDRSILTTQLKMMSKRLWYIITWPSAVLTLVFGIWMLVAQPSWLKLPFMHLKLGFVAMLYIYHFLCHGLFRQLQQDMIRYGSTKLRLFNEIATVILIAVVFIIVLKDELNWLWGMLGLILTSLILIIAVRLYKKTRDRNNGNLNKEIEL